MRDDVIQKILDKKVIAIIRGLDGDVCVRLAEALYAGGIGLIEVTFDQKSPASHEKTACAIHSIRETLAGKVTAGAGTVTSPALVEKAAGAGAEYIVSPNVDIAVIERTRALGLVSLPGAMTPSEILTAHSAGADFVKVFPAGVLGAGYIKAVRAPLNQIRLLAVGGVSEKNLCEFLAAGAVGVGIGGNLVNAEWIKNGEWNRISELAGKISQAANQ